MKVYLNNVTKTYNHRGSPAVNNISFTVEHGEILSLLGPSGCGKTTTLRLLAGFEALDNGFIYFDEKLIASANLTLPPEERNIGMVFQDYALFPHLNVFENITFGIRDKKIKQQTCERLLRLINLTGLEKRYPHELSGGQQQRIALARALSTKPKLILMDEPFSNLDTSLKKQMRDEIKRIVKDSGVSAVMVTHDPEDALVMADKIIIMKNGVIEQQGLPHELYKRPATEFVARFLGEANILDISSFKESATGKVVIRPEDICLSKEGIYECVVEKNQYLGNRVEVALLYQNQTILAKAPNTLVVEKGQRVRFSINWDKAYFLN